jgi:hypothetical protein
MLPSVYLAFVGILAAATRAAPPPYPPAPGNPPAAYQPQPPLAAPTGPLVKLQANKPQAILQQLRLRTWQDLCLMPCGIVVDPTGSYRVGGEGLRDTSSFQMPRPSGEVLVDANMGTSARRRTGIGLTLGGFGAALLGGLTARLGIESDSQSTSNQNTSTNSTGGLVLLIVGIAAVAVGIPLWVTSRSSAEVR